MVKIYILLAILLFGALVALHEFGHFITAKLSGVRVNEFSIGMGPAIIKKQFGETLYSLRILPFGGFCAMEGEDENSEDPRAFGNAKIFRRILIVVAGSFMNLLAGFLVLALVFAPVKEWYVPTVESVPSAEEVDTNTLQAGDVIKSVNGYNVYIYNDIFMGLDRSKEEGKHDIEVLRDGEKVMLSDLGLSYGQKDDGKEGITFETEKTSFWGKTEFVLRNGFNLVRLVYVGLFDLFTGRVSADGMAGPIGIGKIMVETAKVSMASLWYLFAFISINLGLMNLLPIPALDGGRFVFLLFELIFRKPVPRKFEGYVHLVGIIVLLLLMALITFNDIFKMFS